MFSVMQSSYYDMAGNILWSEPMRFGRLDGIGDYLVQNHIEYRVMKVAVAGCVQIVNLANVTEVMRQARFLVKK